LFFNFWYSYNIVSVHYFIVLMKFLFLSFHRPAPGAAAGAASCFKLASPALLQRYQQSARALDRSVRAVKDSEGSNAVCSYQVARGPVQLDRPPAPGAVATGPYPSTGSPQDPSAQ
jgi:hypothetical protein